MYINPYGADPVVLAADLANDPPSDLAELCERCADAGLTMDMPVVPTDLATTTALLQSWLQVVDATEPRRRAELLNRLLAKHSGYPRLTDHDGDGWHLHYRQDGLSLGGVLVTLICVGTAVHLTERGMNRLGRCSAEDCERVFADVSRNGRQQYCSPRCGSRAAVRRHRTRVGAA
ncbi:CGNR zinc finger domain-containing protein [Dermacoccaceae bacterium W4C1]